MSTFRKLALAWCHALLGAAAGLVAVTVALIPGLAPPGPRPFHLVAWLTATLALLLAAGLPRPARRASVRVANALLTTDIPRLHSHRPASADGPARTGLARPDGADGPVGAGRLRSGAWLALHGVLGGVLVTVTVGLAGVAVAAPAVWLGAGSDGEMTYLGLSLRLHGWPGLVAVPLALGHLVLAVLATWGYAVLLRRTAPVLLGPGVAERLAAERQRADVLAHRNRLARELHDSIGHTLTASTLQAAAAGRLLDTANPDPRLLRQTLTAIEESSRTALDDLDQALATLRNSTGASAREAAKNCGKERKGRDDRTLADLPSLLDRLRVAGLVVDATGLDGLPGLPEPVSREAYRIVQEGLTNALRYADPATVTVLTRVDQDRLLIELTNPTRPHDAGPDDTGAVTGPAGTDRATTGRGLAGITERVHLLRGDIEVGPDGGGSGGEGRWRLAVWLPAA